MNETMREREASVRLAAHRFGLLLLASSQGPRFRRLRTYTLIDPQDSRVLGTHQTLESIEAELDSRMSERAEQPAR